MDHPLAVVGVALLLIGALAVTPVSGQVESDGDGEWRTLAPAADGIDRANHTEVGTDLSAVLRRDTIRHTNQHRRTTLDVQRDVVGSDDARFEVLAAELESIAGRLDRLSMRQRGLAAGYGDGRITGPELFTALATIEVQARSLEERLIDIRVAGREIESSGIVRRANDNLARVRTLEGTVRSRVASTQRGADQAGRFYAETANRSIVLAAATEQDYLREVTLPARRKGTGTTIGLSDAVSIVGDAYPELYAARQRIEVGGSRRAGFYRVGIAGTGEFLTSYVDADSRAVFREDRRVSLARLTLTLGPNTTTSDYRLLVEYTYRGGPARITVERPNGDPVDTRVRLDDRVVGTTGDDGRLWTTLSRQTNVTASVEGAVLSVDVETPSPPPLNTSAE